MTILNAGVVVSAGPAAGPNGQARLVADDAAGLRGLLAVQTDAAGLAAGALVIVTLAAPAVADMDAFQVAQGQVNGAVFGGAEVLITPIAPPAPPPGVAFLPLAQMSQGQITGFGIGCTGPLVPSTTYHFSWRVMT